MTQAQLQLIIDARKAKEGAEQAAKALGEVIKQADATGQKLDQTIDKLDKTGGAADGLKSHLAGLAAGFGAFLTFQHIYQVVTRFEQGMIDLAKSSNFSQAEIRYVTDEIDRLSTKLPVGTARMHEIAAAAAQLGIKSKEDVVAFTEVMAKLGMETDINTAEGTRAIVRFMRSTDTAFSKVDKIAATIARLGDETGATGMSLLQTAQTLGEMTTAFDVSAAQALALAAALSQVGVEGGMGAMGLARSFGAINDSIRGETNAARNNMKLLTQIMGQSAEEIGRSFRENATEELVKFIESVGKFKEQGGDVPALLDRLGIGSEKLAKIIPQLAQHSDLLRRSLASANDEMQKGTALNEDAERQSQALSSQVVMLVNKLDLMLGKLIVLRDFFTNKIVVALVAGVGLFLAIQGAIKLATLAMAAFNLVMAANPIVFLLAAAAAAIVYFNDKMGEAQQISRNYGDETTSAWDSVGRAIRRTNEALREKLDLDRQQHKDTLQPGQTGYNNWRNIMAHPASWAMGLDMPKDPSFFGISLGQVPGATYGQHPISAEAPHEMSAVEKALESLENENRKWKAIAMGDAPKINSQAAEDQLRSMNQDLDLQISLIGKTNDERERAIALDKINRLQLKDKTDQIAEFETKLVKLQENRKLEGMFQDIGKSAGDAFTNMIMDMKNVAKAAGDLFLAIEKLILQNMVAQPIANAISGGLSSIAGIRGSGPAPVKANAMGDIFDQPMFFNSGGRKQVLGEAGTEGLFPVTRDSSGRLAVQATGGSGVKTVNVHFHGVSNMDSFRKSGTQIRNEISQAMKGGNT